MNAPPPGATPRPNDRPNDRNDRPTATPRDSGAPSPDPNHPPGANGVTMARAAAFRSPAAAPATAPPRREVLNAMRALHEMPPFAREREIEHGRYSHFSPEEREMLRNAETVRQTGKKDLTQRAAETQRQ